MNVFKILVVIGLIAHVAMARGAKVDVKEVESNSDPPPPPPSKECICEGDDCRCKVVGDSYGGDGSDYESGGSDDNEGNNVSGGSNNNQDIGKVVRFGINFIQLT